VLQRPLLAHRTKQTILVEMSSSCSSETGASVAAMPAIAAQLATPSIDFATEWLDEHGRVCVKDVDYATQCPKGHPLAPFPQDSSSAAAHLQRRLMCRVCHESLECEHVSQSPQSQWRICSVMGCCGGYAVCGSCVNALSGVIAAPAASNDVPVMVSFQHTRCRNCCLAPLLLPVTSVQGISLQYLQWLQLEFGPLLGRMTTSQFEKMYLRPRTSRRRCSVTEELAAHAASAQHVGPATWFISHTWSNPFADTLQAILIFFEGREDSANAMLWFDVFVDSQHVSAGPSKSPQWYMTTFKDSIARIGSLLLVVDLWDDPTALTRAWSVWPPFVFRARSWLHAT
jgi:hypothetical protein